MKHTDVRAAIVVLVLGILNFTSAPGARADDQTREEAIALLTSGIWHFAGTDWSNDRVFDRKGTVLVRASNARGVIKWKMDSKRVTIMFADHDDVLYLPIDPKGTKGTDGHGNDVVATQVPGSTSGAQSDSPPSALDALKPIAPGAPGAQPQLPAGDLLTSTKWHFEGANWSEIRVFDPNGTMTIINNPNVAHWQIAGNKIVMTFKDHKDILYLPLDPKGTKGMDEYGRLFIATQYSDTNSTAGPSTAAPPGQNGTSAPSSGSSYFGTGGHSATIPTPTPLPPSP